METYCNRDEWIAANQIGFNWYLETYPFLKDVGFPVSTATLKNFYVEDSKNRNITPNEVIKNCYEFLFSYFLENYPNVDNPNRFVARNWFELLLDSMPQGIEKTFNDSKEIVSDLGDSLSEFLNVSKYVIFLVLIIIVLYLWTQIK